MTPRKIVTRPAYIMLPDWTVKQKLALIGLRLDGVKLSKVSAREPNRPQGEGADEHIAAPGMPALWSATSSL